MNGTNLALEPEPPTSDPPVTVLQGAALRAHPASAAVTLSSGRRYEIDVTPLSDRLVVHDRLGEIVLRIDVTDFGPKVAFVSPSSAESARRSGVREAPGSAFESGSGTVEAAPLLTPIDEWSRVDPAPPSLRAIAPPPSSAGALDDGGHGAGGVSVPRAMPLPAIRNPSELDPPYFDAYTPAELSGAGTVVRDSTWTGVRPRRDPGTVRESAFISETPLRARAFTSMPPALEDRDAEPAPTRRASPSLGLEQYAALCAELSVGPHAAFEQALFRYGIAGQDAWNLFDRGWQERFAREPILTLKWMELTAST